MRTTDLIRNVRTAGLRTRSALEFKLQLVSSIALGLAALTTTVALTGCHSPGRRFNPYIPETYKPLDLSQVILTNQVGSDLLKPSTKPFTLGPGDRLEIEVLGDPLSRTATAVGPDGKIYFHLLPGIDVWGLTLAETKSVLEQRLTEFIKEPPTVGITLRGVESRRVWLLGRFTTPGVYTMPAPMTVLEAIAMAGGTMSMTGTREAGTAMTGEEIADLRRAFVMRKGQRLPVDFRKLLLEGDLAQNIYLEPDDFLYFPTATAREVTVLGAVGQPRSVPYFQGLSLVGAIAHAGGTVDEAYWNHVAILRGSLSEPYVAIVDYKDMAQGRAADVPLEAGDIVYVPYTPYRYLTRYADLIVKTFVGSVAINEGTRAVIRDAGDTRVVVPLQPVGGGATATPVVR
jgi:polysaccharide biosynthesis/export protein